MTARFCLALKKKKDRKSIRHDQCWVAHSAQTLSGWLGVEKSKYLSRSQTLTVGLSWVLYVNVMTVKVCSGRSYHRLSVTLTVIWRSQRRQIVKLKVVFLGKILSDETVGDCLDAWTRLWCDVVLFLTWAYIQGRVFWVSTVGLRLNSKKVTVKGLGHSQVWFFFTRSVFYNSQSLTLCCHTFNTVWMFWRKFAYNFEE